jgi:hypothetical protein
VVLWQYRYRLCSGYSIEVGGLDERVLQADDGTELDQRFRSHEIFRLIFYRNDSSNVSLRKLSYQTSFYFSREIQVLISY